MRPVAPPQTPIPTPLIEPTHVPDVLVSGIAAIESLGGCIARFTLYVESRGPSEDAPPDRLVVARIAIPISALPFAVQQTLVFLGGHSIAEIVETVQRLAH